MASSRAATVAEYLAELSPERRAVIATVRDVVRHSLPDGFDESMNWGMICWGIPLSRYPDTYNGQPLGVAALAAQKNHCALYLNGLYMDPARAARFERRFSEAGKKLDMGKSCVRFRRLEDLDLEAVAEVIASTTPDDLIAMYEASRRK